MKKKILNIRRSLLPILHKCILLLIFSHFADLVTFTAEEILNERLFVQCLPFILNHFLPRFSEIIFRGRKAKYEFFFSLPVKCLKKTVMKTWSKPLKYNRGFKWMASTSSQLHCVKSRDVFRTLPNILDVQ